MAPKPIAVHTAVKTAAGLYHNGCCIHTPVSRTMIPAAPAIKNNRDIFFI
jgi:hypothetical protein